MTELLDTAQMRGLEAAAMASGSVTGAMLMERAGRGVVEAIFARWPEMAAGGGAAVVLCGPGNNGGDGYVIARLLHGWGWSVRVFALAAPVRPDAREMRARWDLLGATRPLVALGERDLSERPLVIDALFGTGLARPIAADLWHPIAMAQDHGCRIVAVDILSGLCADSGQVRSEGGYLRHPADLTVTFERRKRGHVLDPGAGFGGTLKVVPIGLAGWLKGLCDPRDMVRETTPDAALGKSMGKTSGHKYSHGHALILSGGVGRGGAARLAARGALRIGAGLVTLACPGPALPENAARLDAIMLRRVDDADGLAALLQDTRLNALCLGPGLGIDGAAAASTRALVSAALRAGRATVLDADALTAFADDPEELFDLLHPDCVLTPHAGEFTRLFPDLAAELKEPQQTGAIRSKVDVTRAAAARAGCTVLSKGADTVIAAPDGQARINVATGAQAAPWLATAGTGDVLTGFIGGLMARGFGPLDAAQTASWLHVACARSFGPGLISEDLPEQLPQVYRALGF